MFTQVTSRVALTHTIAYGQRSRVNPRWSILNERYRKIPIATRQTEIRQAGLSGNARD